MLNIVTHSHPMWQPKHPSHADAAPEDASVISLINQYMAVQRPEFSTNIVCATWNANIYTKKRRVVRRDSTVVPGHPSPRAHGHLCFILRR